MKHDEEERARRATMRALKKPIIRGINFFEIKTDLEDMAEQCSDISWAELTDILEDFCFNDAEAMEIRFCMANLDAAISQMLEDIYWDREKDIELMDAFLFVGLCETQRSALVYDPVREDYYPYEYAARYLEDGVKERLKRLTKEEMFDYTKRAFSLFANYMSLKTRFDTLHDAIKIVQHKFEGFHTTLDEINRLYDEVDDWRVNGTTYTAKYRFDSMLEELPKECWVM